MFILKYHIHLWDGKSFALNSSNAPWLLESSQFLAAYFIHPFKVVTQLSFYW